MRGFATDPAASAGVRLFDDLPEPAPAADELVVEVRAYAINRGELALIQQRTGAWRPGQDVAGLVVRGAEGGGGPPAGSRVVGLVDWHGWAERVAVPVDCAVELPEDVSFEEAASLPIAGITALRALRVAGPLAGRRVLVTGATGGVGHFAIQLAAGAGAHVTAYVSSDERAEFARALGAHDAITSLAEGGEGSEADAGGDAGGRGEPFDVVLDALGGTVLRDALHRMAPEGTAIGYGMVLGTTELSFVDFRSARNSRFVGLFHAHPPETRGDDLATLVRLVAEGRLRPHLGLIRDWEETPAALGALANRAVRGKAVLTRS